MSSACDGLDKKTIVVPNVLRKKDVLKRPLMYKNVYKNVKNHRLMNGNVTNAFSSKITVF